MKWVTADTHFFHKNICELAHRPFDSVEDMNETIIGNWNSAVGPKDEVYHLGDFALGRRVDIEATLDKLNGRIHLIKGNHDQVIKGTLAERFVWVKERYSLRDGDDRFVLDHYPLASWHKAHRGAMMLHGHCHGTLIGGEQLPRIDVGVDSWGYAPVALDTIRATLKGRTFVGGNHHQEG